MKSSCFGQVVGKEINVANCGELVNCFAMDGNWCKHVFRLKNPKKYNVTGFFFQLLAIKIISFKVVGQKNVVCVV